MAAGKWLGILQTLVTEGTSKVLILAAQLPTEDERSKIISDWHSARSQIEEVLRVKFGFWQNIPYLIVAIGHPDEVVARETLRLAMLQYVSSAANTKHHKITQQAFDRGPLNDDVRRFLNGTPLEELPHACVFAARLAGIPLIERSIEHKKTWRCQERLESRRFPIACVHITQATFPRAAQQNKQECQLHRHVS